MNIIYHEDKPHLLLFAISDIQPNTEIRYNYGATGLWWRKKCPQYNKPFHLEVIIYKIFLSDVNYLLSYHLQLEILYLADLASHCQVCNSSRAVIQYSGGPTRIGVSSHVRRVICPKGHQSEGSLVRWVVSPNASPNRLSLNIGMVMQKLYLILCIMPVNGKWVPEPLVVGYVSQSENGVKGVTTT